MGGWGGGGTCTGSPSTHAPPPRSRKITVTHAHALVKPYLLLAYLDAQRLLYAGGVLLQGQRHGPPYSAAQQPVREELKLRLRFPS